MNDPNLITRGLQTGRMIGKTRYFHTASDGTITLPSNHVSRYEDPYLIKVRAGAQNITHAFSGSGNSRIFNGNREDYSSASFYRVKVTGGENQLIVRSGRSIKDSDGRIIY